MLKILKYKNVGTSWEMVCDNLLIVVRCLWIFPFEVIYRSLEENGELDGSFLFILETRKTDNQIREKYMIFLNMLKQ
jgi:hypothetical protein